MKKLTLALLCSLFAGGVFASELPLPTVINNTVNDITIKYTYSNSPNEIITAFIPGKLSEIINGNEVILRKPGPNTQATTMMPGAPIMFSITSATSGSATTESGPALTKTLMSGACSGFYMSTKIIISDLGPKNTHLICTTTL